MVAVNRMYNKSDYVPCIAWGRNANFADRMTVGTRDLSGREDAEQRIQEKA